MPVAESSNKPSWADRVEQGEDAALPGPIEKVDGDKKTVTEIKEVEGKKVKVTRHYKVERRQVSRSVARRKQWHKFGDSEEDPPGPSAATTVIGDEILMQLISLKGGVEEEKEPEEEVQQQLLKQKLKSITCRICKEDHWSAYCPHKDKLPFPDMLEGKAGDTDAAGAAAGAVAMANKTGKYIAPGLRDGGNRRGESMGGSRGMRDDAATIRVTNLSEECKDQDLQELFKPFGQVVRIFLAKDKVTNQSKGFAFVNYATKEEAARAIYHLNGYGYDNLILSVEWAKPSGNQ